MNRAPTYRRLSERFERLERFELLLLFLPFPAAPFCHAVAALSYCAVLSPPSGYQRLKPKSFDGLPNCRSSRIFCPSGLKIKSAISTAAWGCGAWYRIDVAPALVGTASIGAQSIGAPLSLDSIA